MKAAYIEGPGAPASVIVGEMPEPSPGPGDVRVKMRAAGVGPWDVKAMQGMFGELKLPYVVGFEFAGTVDQMGEGVTGVAVGDDVFGTDWRAASFAEYRVVAADALGMKPKKFSFAEAAALPVAGTTSLEGLFERLEIKEGESVLITAASGGVGTIAVQMAHAAGSRVVGVSSSANRDYVLALGAEAVFDYHDEDWPEQVRKHFPEGVDALFDCAGGDTLTKGFEAVRDGGRAVGIVYGGPGAGPRGITFERFSAASGQERMQKVAAMADEGKLLVELAA
ncbi:MAG TPA: NADP-dependent oxidoreductase [Candidatus Dormibacteraeota bacterium]|nr:NADP-dependent oxidoreductase [Candidatus Dormibacteraeota bacterium]